MKNQFTLLLTLLLSTSSIFAQDVDVTVSTSNVNPIIKAGEYTLLSWSVKSRNNTATEENKIKFYLSQDSVLNDEDLFLGGSVAPELIEGSESQIHYTWIQIPSNVTTGNYNVLFYVDADNEIAEVSESDNIKAEFVEVAPSLKSDLVVASTDLPLVGTEGNQIEIGWTVRNQGLAISSPTSLSVYLSETPEITATSIKLLETNVITINSGAHIADEAIVTLPSDSSIDGGVVGKRYIVFDVDENGDVRESNETNNMDFKRVTIERTAADLVSTSQIAYGSIDYYAPHAKDVFYNVQFTVENQGTDNSGTVSVAKCYLSIDDQLDDNDQLIRTINIPDLNANGETYEVDFSDRWDHYVPSGPGGSSSLEDKLYLLYNYKVIIVLDVQDSITESNEDNNTSSHAITTEPSQQGFRTSESRTTAFPVPAEDVLNVSVANNTTITLYDTSNGAVVIDKAFTKAGQYRIDTTSLKRGIYILKDNKGKEISIVKE